MQSALTFAATSILFCSILWTVIEFVRFSWHKSSEQPQPEPQPESQPEPQNKPETQGKLTVLRQKWGCHKPVSTAIVKISPEEVEAILNPRKTASRKSTASSKGGSKRSPRSKVVAA